MSRLMPPAGLQNYIRPHIQWRSDAVRGPGSAVRSGSQGTLQCHDSPKGLWVRDSRVSSGSMWHAHKSSVAETKLIPKKALMALTPL